MNCKTCETAPKTIATKILRRSQSGITKCHRLDCGHAWHVEAPVEATGLPEEQTATPCGCGEIAIVTALLVTGRRLSVDADMVDEEVSRAWSAQVLDALDGVPAESGAPSLVRSAATAAKSPTSSRGKKVTELNKLLVRAINAVT